MKKKSKVEGLIRLHFKTYYKTIVIKTVWYWQKDRHIGQWKKTESPEINPYIYGQLILIRALRQFSMDIIVFSANGAGIIGYTTQKNESGPLYIII